MATTAELLFSNDEIGLEHFHGSCIPEFRETKSAALLSEAKHLLLFEEDGDKQILRFAQNDRGGAVYTNTENALALTASANGASRVAVFALRDEQTPPRRHLHPRPFGNKIEPEGMPEGMEDGRQFPPK